MSLRNNPFAKFVPNPSNIPDPNTIKPTDFEKYHSRDMQKLSENMRVLKRSSRYLAGCFAMFLGLTFAAENFARHQVFGADKQGGQSLTLRTPHDEHHYAYNRQFQRMQVLGQAKIGDESQHSKQMLADMGVKLENYGAPNAPKKAPHEKYY